MSHTVKTPANTLLLFALSMVPGLLVAPVIIKTGLGLYGAASRAAGFVVREIAEEAEQIDRKRLTDRNGD